MARDKAIRSKEGSSCGEGGGPLKECLGGGVAVVGSGYWGKNLVRNFAELGHLAAVCDKDATLSMAFRSVYPSIPFFSDVSEILNNSDIQGVAIATPAATHHRLAKEALLANKDVFVEKPLSLRCDEAAELVALARDRARILMVGHILQYHPAIEKLQELIRSGSLGRLQYICSNRLNIGKVRTEENILWSFAPHDISAILSLLSEQPVRVTSEGASFLSEGVADVTVSHLSFPSGVAAHIYVSWLHPFKEQRLVVIGTEQMAVFDDLAAEKLVLYRHKVEWRNRTPTAVRGEGQAVALEMSEPLRKECSQFLRSIATREAPPTDGKQGLEVLRVLTACQRSLETRCSVQLSDLESARPITAGYFAHETAVVDEPAEIGAGTKIWHFSHVMKDVTIGRHCILGQNCHVASGAVLGNNVKVQNNVSIYAGVLIEDDVFLGPSCVLTNVTNPRAEVNRHSLYERTVIRRGATIGANATVVCGVELGQFCFIGAGCVVTKNVPDYALVLGNPGRQVGWMSRHGHRLSAPDSSGVMICPESGLRYQESPHGRLRCLDLDEQVRLPAELSLGRQSYDELKGR